MTQRSEGSSPHRPRWGLYLFSLGLVLVLIGGSRALSLMQRDALWIGETRVFPPWFHKTIRLSQTDAAGRVEWLDLVVGTTDEFANYGRQFYTSPPPPFHPRFADNSVRPYVFRGYKISGNDGVTCNGHPTSGSPVQDFGVTVRQLFGFYFVSLDPRQYEKVRYIRPG